MGIENMRRWPMYIVFAVCILLLLSLMNSWSLETELRNRIAEISTQLQECSKQQTTCAEESLTLLDQRNGYVVKINELDRQKVKLSDNLAQYKDKLSKSEIQLNQTRGDTEMCKTELQTIKNLQISKSAMLDALRFKKDSLTTQLADSEKKVQELQKEMERLKASLTTKSASAPQMSKFTPAALPPKMSPSLNAHNPINEPVLEDNAKEEMEDINGVNDPNDIDPQLQ